MDYKVEEYPPQNGGKWGGYKCSAHEPVGEYYKQLATLQPANIDTKWGGVDQNKQVSDIVAHPEGKSNNGIPH
jgi:hypothetical protein